VYASRVESGEIAGKRVSYPRRVIASRAVMPSAAIRVWSARYSRCCSSLHSRHRSFIERPKVFCAEALTRYGRKLPE
jgi:hypothetical protein